MTEDFSLEQARQKAESQQWTVQRVIEHVDPNDLFDHKFLQWCETVRSELVPGLRQALWQQDGYSRLNISHLLLKLGEAEGAAGILDCLRANDQMLNRSALVTLGILPFKPLTDSSPDWQRPPVPIQKTELLAALQPFLDVPDSHEGSLALNIAFSLELPETSQQLAPLLNHPAQEVRMQVAIGFLRRGEDHGALAAAEALLREELDAHNLISALEDCTEKADPELALEAANLLMRYVLAHLNRSDNKTANAICRAIEGLKAVQHPQEAETLQALFLC